MKSLSLLLLPLLFASSLFADRFNVGGTEINLPAPAGYIQVGDEMPQLKRFLAAIEDPVNNTLAVYVMPEAAEIALAGELPELERYFMAKVSKRAVKAVVSVAEFKDVRAALVGQQEKGMEELRKRMPEMMEKIEKNLSDEMGIEGSLQVTEIVLLGVYMDEPNAVGYSMLVGMGGEDGWQMMVSSAVVNVSGKVVSLYAYGQVGDLEWTRESSVAWVGTILASNPPAPASNSGSLDWRRLITGCVSAIVISGAIGLFKHRQRLKRI